MAPLGVTDVDSASFMEQYEEWAETLLPTLLSYFKVSAAGGVAVRGVCLKMEDGSCAHSKLHLLCALACSHAIC
jgi:hypothetical protein